MGILQPQAGHCQIGSRASHAEARSCPWCRSCACPGTSWKRSRGRSGSHSPQEDAVRCATGLVAHSQVLLIKAPSSRLDLLHKQVRIFRVGHCSPWSALCHACGGTVPVGAAAGLQLSLPRTSQERSASKCQVLSQISAWQGAGYQESRSHSTGMSSASNHHQRAPQPCFQPPTATLPVQTLTPNPKTSPLKPQSQGTGAGRPPPSMRASWYAATYSIPTAMLSRCCWHSCFGHLRPGAMQARGCPQTRVDR